MSRAYYSSDELAAMSAADILADDGDVPKEELRRILNALAYEGERTRAHLDKALWTLLEPSRRKREIVRDIIRSERA